MSELKSLRSRFERFCFQNKNKGIPNLMLYITLGSAIVYILSMFDRSSTLYYALCFNRPLILEGQIWRLFTYAFTYNAGNLLLTAIGLVCYYSLGSVMERYWGTLKFNLFYLSGMVIMDLYALVVGHFTIATLNADIFYLNMSLFLAYATMHPNAHFLFLFFIPVKAWIFAIIELALVIFQLFTSPFPYNLFPVVALLNYFLFFGKDVLNVIPMSWRINLRRSPKKQKPSARGPIPFRPAANQSAAAAKAPYTHRCTVCGRTDVSHPDLEFRYCSKCNGYYCYCQEHISNHTHIH